MKTLKVGHIGAGQVAWGNCGQIREHPRAELVAIADPSRKRAGDLAGKMGASRVYESARELIADPDIDAVAIAVPNAFHAPQAIAALEAGKHVLLDKPFALNLGEAKAVAAAARKAKRVFTVGMNQRFNPDSQTIKACVLRGDLGQVYAAKAYLFRRSGIPKFGTWFCQKKLAGGGVLLDIGVHMLDLCLYLAGNFRPVTVSGVTCNKFGGRGLGEGGWGMSDRGRRVFDVEDFATAFIRLDGGATVTLEITWACHQEQPTRMNVELFGTEAGAGACPARLYRYGRGKNEYDVVEPQGVQGPYAGRNRFTNWIDAILNEAKPCVSVEESLAVQKILDAIYLSARAGKEVRV